MVRDIQELVRGKSIVFVGNSVEIMHHKLAKEIDKYDIVVRFGRAILATPEQEKSLGSRVDIWVTGQFRSPCYNNRREDFETGIFKDVQILLNRCRGNFRLKDWIIEDRLPEGMEYTQMYTDEEIAEVMMTFDKDMYNPSEFRPSAGFLTILWFIQKVKTHASIDLVGFDFFAKSVGDVLGKDKRGRISASPPHSWHLPVYILNRSAHDRNMEQQYVSYLERKGMLKWHVLSDLKIKEIEYDGWMTNEKLTKTAPKKSKVSKILPRAQKTNL